ncbi:MAG TPA: 30S ribosomal protein S6 [candidate division Zixibacteria bacterium]|nr:30S ribosomal protein S6 [candidate division Zixibacteria bacterium]
MRRYELMLLFRPDLEDDKLQSAVEKVTRAIVNAGGALTKVSPWGKRRLAYPIQHFREASYFLIHFDIAPSAVRGIERGLLISEEILRHLVVVLEDRSPLSEEDLAPAAVPAAASDDEAIDEDEGYEEDLDQEDEAAVAEAGADEDEVEADTRERAGDISPQTAKDEGEAEEAEAAQA